MQQIEQFFIAFGDKAWGMPLLILLMGGGIFFTFYIRLIPFRYIKHALDILRGKYDDDKAEGDISHYEALATALAATVGMGNVSGVAVAITMGGPGAVFWMWVSALLGISTKFFTCTLAVMFRGKDSLGVTQGGPMYVIMEGLGKNWKPLAALFCVAGMFGPLPIFNANQLVQTFRDVLFIPNGIEPSFQTNLTTGIILSVLVAIVIFGGIQRIGKVAGKLVPLMVAIYVLVVLYILGSHIGEIPSSFGLIISDAFSGNAVMGGAVGAVIVAGARRAAFSNEAGLGTAPMAHGAAKTNEPIREGLIAMLGPFIDTIIVCTMTALAIIVTDSWQNTTDSGISITLNAFNSSLPGFGTYILLLCVFIFSITTMFSQSYYASKCFSFLFGAEYQNGYKIMYVISVLIGAITSLKAVIGFIDGMYALMAIPTIISTILLAPKVRAAAKEYFGKLKMEKA